MESINSTKTTSSTTAKFDDLPKERSWGGREFFQWEGFWFAQPYLAGALAARSNFPALDEDVILASSVKTGTTWLKAIIPCIINCKEEDYDPFVDNHPNELMPSLECQLFRKDPNPDLSGLTSPRLFRTHMPYPMLPESIKTSCSKMVYITRNPKDVIVSLWHFMNTNMPTEEPYPFDEAYESFCKGVHPFGPFHDHVLGYWKESLKRPEKILFLKYEELKSDPKGQLKKLTEFLGRPLVDLEVEKILQKCSLERLKNLEINKNGVDPHVGFAYKAYFRLGLVGDWKNHLTAEMKERLDNLTKTKLEGSGLDL